MYLSLLALEIYLERWTHPLTPRCRLLKLRPREYRLFFFGWSIVASLPRKPRMDSYREFFGYELHATDSSHCGFKRQRISDGWQFLLGRRLYTLSVPR